MKVILSCWGVFPFHGNYGICKYVYGLAKYLIKCGVDAEIVTSVERGARRTEMYDGIKYTLLPPRCLGRHPISPWQHIFNVSLARYLRAVKFDILHSFTHSSFVYLHLKNRGTTVVQPFSIEPFTTVTAIEKRGMGKIYLDILSRYPWKYCITHADAVAMEGEFI